MDNSTGADPIIQESTPSMVRVLYIMGDSRSGSTILGNVLGEIKGLSSVGELRALGESKLENWACGCGITVNECAVWKAVLRKAFDGNHPRSFFAKRLRRRAGRFRYILLWFVPGGRALLRAMYHYALDDREKIYRALASVTGAYAIVDTSKSPTYAYLLGQIQSIDLYVVHLVRDPRGVSSSSLQKRKLIPDGRARQLMPRRSLLRTALEWMLINFVSEQVARTVSHRHLTLRYEDFVAEPMRSIQRIIDLMEMGQINIPIAEAGKVRLGINHTVSGNPVRFCTGTVELKLDERWRYELKPAHQRLVTTLTWPIRLRYGYTEL